MGGTELGRRVTAESDNRTRRVDNGQMRNAVTSLNAVDGESDSGPKSLTTGAYQRLRADIISGRLKAGSRLRVEHLKDNYEVGAGTLREALALLVADALVITLDQRGYRVAPMSLQDFHDITETRALIESSATRQSIANGNDAWEGNLFSAFHQLTRAEERLAPAFDEEMFDQWEACNKRFHGALLAQCASYWTLHLLQILYRQSERYRRLSLAHRSSLRDVHGEHRMIFEAAIDRDQDRAAALVAQHIRATYAVVAAMVDAGTISLDRHSLVAVK